MPTYGDLRDIVLRALDVDVDVTGDTRSAVDDAMAYIMDELAFDIRPLQLFNTAGPVNVTVSTTEIPLNASGFLVTNLAEIRSIAVDLKTTADPDIQIWEEISYEAYQRQNNAQDGDIRKTRSWTFSPDEEFILTEWPTGTDTWDVYLNYYETPAAITDNGYPELPKLHQRVIALGALTMFPQYFTGDRVALFTKYQEAYTQGKGRLLSARRANQAIGTLHTRAKKRGSMSVNWGAG